MSAYDIHLDDKFGSRSLIDLCPGASSTVPVLRAGRRS